MSDNIPTNLKYTRDHEWVRVNGSRVVIGITAHAQTQLGDVVHVELPKLGDSFEAGAEMGTVESVKAVSEVYSPLTGKVVKVNEALTDSPESINDDPYGEGWMVELELSDSKQADSLLDAAAYEKLTQET